MPSSIGADQRPLRMPRCRIEDGAVESAAGAPIRAPGRICSVCVPMLVSDALDGLSEDGVVHWLPGTEGGVCATAKVLASANANAIGCFIT